MTEGFESPRAIAERERLGRIAAFDALIDISLQGALSREEAIHVFATLNPVEVQDELPFGEQQ